VFRGLTQRVQHILSHEAQDEAKRFNSDQLLPEHIIIAMLKDGAGTACKALQFLRIDLHDFRQNIESSIPYISSILVQGDVLPSLRTRKMLENASEDAKAMGNEYLGTEHLLFAALNEKNSATQIFLKQHEINPDLFRALMQTSFNRRGYSEAGYGVSETYTPLFPRLDERAAKSSFLGERQGIPRNSFYRSGSSSSRSHEPGIKNSFLSCINSGA